jgi:hypothetical protein
MIRGTRATNTPTTSSSARMLPNKRKLSDSGLVFLWLLIEYKLCNVGAYEPSTKQNIAIYRLSGVLDNSISISKHLRCVLSLILYNNPGQFVI